MSKPFPLKGSCVTNPILCISFKWTLMSYSIGVLNALQKKHFKTNIPSKVCCGSCIRLRGNSACNSRDSDSFFLNGIYRIWQKICKMIKKQSANNCFSFYTCS